MSDRVSILIAIYLTCSSLGWGSNPKLSWAIAPPLIVAQAETTTPEAPPLQAGSEGKDVRVLQHLLKELGYFQGPLDGKYGPGTQTAISDFQKDEDLEVTGIADAKTRERIKASYEEKQKPPQEDKDSQDEKKSSPWKLPFSRQRIILFLGGLITLSLGGIGLFLLLRAFNQAMPAPAAPLYDEDEADAAELEPVEPLSPEEISPLNRAPEPLEQNLETFQPLPEIVAESSPPPPKPAPEPRAPKAKARKGKNANIKASTAKSLAVKQPARLPKLDLVEELIKDLQKPSAEIRRKAIWELAQRADSRAVKPLIGLLIDSDSQQRGLILEALSQIGTRTLEPMNRALTMALQDENAQVRKNAIRDLTQMYELVAKLSKAIYLAADDPDPEVQDTARWALNQLNSHQIPQVKDEE